MCGLWGYSSSVSIINLKQVGIQLALYNEERGKQSWGIYNNKELIKDIGPIGRELWKIPFADKGVMIGHTRAATVGDVNQVNAHPFMFNMKNGATVVGAHNGSISNHKELNEKYKRNLQVDSMQIFAHIADELDLSEIEGYGAITFMKEGVLYFSRFNGGSLSIAQIKNGGLIWSSEEFALTKALAAANLDYFLYEVKEGRIYYFTKDQLWDSEEDIAIESSSKRYQYQRQRSFHDGHYQGQAQWPHQNGGNKSSGNDGKRVVRLRVIRPSVIVASDNPGAAPQVTLDANPAKLDAATINEVCCEIWNREDISVQGSHSTKCTCCNTMTPRKLVTGEPMCLSCTAGMVKSGEIIVNDLPINASALLPKELSEVN